jgi:glycosyltransferase involved in cell wall biosynthesis
MDHPQVTWLLPVRNGMPYLPATLESVKAQTYPHHSIIAWDNGSTDGTLEILRTWIPNRVQGVIVADQPLRLGPTMAALVKMAETELCAIIHGDDLCLPGRLEKQVAFMQAHPEVGALGSQIEVIDDHGVAQDTGPYWKYETEDASVRWRTRWQSQFCHPAVMLRRSAVLAAGNYRDCQPYEDTDLWIRMADVAELRNLPDILMRYRRSASSSTGRIVEYIDLEREAASMNIDLLFPGMTDKARILDLWEATHPYYLGNPSKFRHMSELRRAAVNLAKKLGKPVDYFTGTPLFDEQEVSLKNRFYKRSGLMPLVELRRSLSARASAG